MATQDAIRTNEPRSPSTNARCTCTHWLDCDCVCHDRHCDPVLAVCHVDFLPDEGGLARWGCPRCTPGEGVPHDASCDLIGWNVRAKPRYVRGAGSIGLPSAY